MTVFLTIYTIIGIVWSFGTTLGVAVMNKEGYFDDLTPVKKTITLFIGVLVSNLAWPASVICNIKSTYRKR